MQRGRIDALDESRPAVQFNVLSEPSEIVRQATAVREGGPVSEARQLQGEFWAGFRELLLAKKIVVSAQAARPQYWFNVALGRAYIHLSNIASVADNRIGVRVYISNRVASEALPQLEAQKSEIESEIGSPLKWNPNPNAIDKVIVLDRLVDLDDRTKWPEYFEWLCEQVSRFKKAFEPRIKQLKYSQADGEPDLSSL